MVKGQPRRRGRLGEQVPRPDDGIADFAHGSPLRGILLAVLGGHKPHRSSEDVTAANADELPDLLDLVRDTADAARRHAIRSGPRMWF